MSLPRALVLAAAVLLGACTAATRPGGPAPLSLIPQVGRLELQPGAFELGAKTWLVVPPNNVSVRRIAEQFAERVRHSRGLRLPVAEIGVAATRDAIVLVLDPAVAGEGAYRLDVGPDQVSIRAGTPQGLFYGTVTLWQALTSSPGDRVPAMHVEDAPRFGWRGLMLDSARHFQTPAQIRVLLDQMALHKLNVLHWHLTDDQGWRIQIKRYPALTRIGAWRTPPDAGHWGEPARYGGFYSQDDVRALVRYAAARYITIVPEIDLPGHAQAAVAAYPWLGVPGRRPPVSVDWGVHRWLFNAEPSTLTFLENVLDEVMALFPSHYIHLGGGEAVKDQWLTSPQTQARIRALGLADEDQLQGWMMGQLGEYLQSHGRRMIGWDEVLQGGVPADAAVMSSRGTAGAVEAARKDHDVVLSPPALHLDRLQSDREDEPAGRMPVESLADLYAFEPVPATLDPGQARHVLGAQATVSTELMPSMAHIEHAVFPRLDALAEALWTPAARHDWPDFLARLPAQLARYRREGIAYADSTFAPAIDVDAPAALAGDETTLTLSNQAGFGTIRYTLDGSTPTKGSPTYARPVAVSVPTTVHAIVFAPDGSALAAARSRVIDRPHLLTRSGATLVDCPGSAFRLRVQPMPDATSLAPVYTINPFNSCQTWPAAPLEGINAIRVALARLPRNYQLAHEDHRVVQHAAGSAHGELQVHRDGCAGPLLAHWPLSDPAAAPRRFDLDAPIELQQGAHDLCLLITAPTDGPIYAFDQVSLHGSPSPDRTP